MRYYHIGDQWYPSVTTILSEVLPKEAINRWKERTPDWEKQQREAQIVGTLVHFRILHALHRKIYPYMPPILHLPLEEIGECDEKLLSCIEISESMYSALGLPVAPPLKIEQLVYSHKHRFAGRFDMLAQIDDQTTLVDFKTSRREYRSHLLQLAGYALAMKKFPEQGLLIYLDYREESNPFLRPKLVYYSEDELRRAGTEFLACVNEYHDKYQKRPTHFNHFNSTSLNIFEDDNDRGIDPGDESRGGLSGRGNDCNLPISGGNGERHTAGGGGGGGGGGVRF